MSSRPMFTLPPSALAPLVLLAATYGLSGCRSAEPGTRPEGPAVAFTEQPPVALEHVSLELTLDPGQRTIVGRALLRLRAEQPRITLLPLQLERLTVQRVTDAAGGNLAFSQTDGELAVMLAAPLLEGETVEIAVEYGGRPERGLSFVEELAVGEVVAHTDGRPGTSVWWFPSVVLAGQDVTSELVLDLPAAWVAAGSGRRERSEVDDRAQVRFVADRPHAIDQLGFVAGPLLRLAADEGDCELAVLGAPTRPGALELALEELTRAARFGRDLLGPESLPAAMSLAYLPSAERPGAGALGLGFIDDVGADTVAVETFDRLVAAGLVPETWSDGWLPGAMGRYLAALYAEGIGGREALAAALDRAGREATAARPSGPAGSLASESFVEPSDLVDGGWRDAAGAQVLHLVRGAVGDEAFLVGVRSLFDESRGGLVDDDDLFRHVGEAAQLDLTTLREQWVDAPGRPEFDVSWEYEASAGEVALRVRQRQAGDDGTPRVFEVPVEVEIVAGSEVAVHLAQVSERSETLRFPISERPRWVRFDRGGWLPGEVVERKSADEWMALTTARDDVHGRATAVAALAEEARGARRAEQTIYLTQLGSRLERDSSPRVRRAAATALGDVGGTAARLWLERAAVEDASPVVRAAALEALEAFVPSVELAALAVERLENDPEVAAEALSLRAAAEPESAGAFLRARWTTAADPRVRAAVVESLARAEGSQSEPWLLAAAADASLPILVRRAALTALGDRGLVENATAEGVASLLASSPAGVREAAVTALAGWPNAPARSALEAHYPQSVEPTERRAIEAALRLDR